MNPKPKSETQAIAKTTIQTQMQPESKAETEILWELNSLDEKEEQEPEKKDNTNLGTNTYISSQQSPSAVTEGT